MEKKVNNGDLTAELALGEIRKKAKDKQISIMPTISMEQRNRRGRPKKNEEPRNLVTKTYSLDANIIKEIEAIAMERGLNINQVINHYLQMGIESYIKKYGLPDTDMDKILPKDVL